MIDLANKSIERTAAPILRPMLGGGSDTPFTRRRPCRRRSLTSGVGQ
jgi:hypothetical protein